MKLLLIRKKYDLDYTHGELFVDDKFFCHTLEDAIGTKKVYGETAIPTGIYNVVISYSNHFKRDLPELLNVPNYAGIRIHGGNTSADTLGCILVGKKSDNNGKIWECGEVLNDLIAKIRNTPTKIEIV